MIAGYTALQQIGLRLSNVPLDPTSLNWAVFVIYTQVVIKRHPSIPTIGFIIDLFAACISSKRILPYAYSETRGQLGPRTSLRRAVFCNLFVVSELTIGARCNRP